MIVRESAVGPGRQASALQGEERVAAGFRNAVGESGVTAVAIHLVQAIQIATGVLVVNVIEVVGGGAAFALLKNQ